MFTIQQIKDTHSKVKSGADFPQYVQDMIGLGVKSYDLYVHDGHAVYRGANGYEIQSDAKYAPLPVNDNSNAQQFTQYLKSHQQGGTDYPTFCQHSAETGVEKWTTDMEAYTCTYYDKAGNVMLEEEIPRINS
jgi:uncharacterized protein YbcV (DUF1398 family)